jgi:phospholipid/cholesterol/gamma-HCH transport system substrate-binding protein
LKRNEAKVGALVVLSAVVLCTTIYFLGSAQFGRTRTPYRTYLKYAGGLAPGTDVLFGGIAVGKVTAVSSDPSDPTRIEIDFDVKQGTPVNSKSLAKLGSISLMSPPVVSITTGTKDSPRLQAGAAISSEETVSLDDMQREIAALAQSAQSLIAAVHTDVDNITGDTRRVLANVNDLTGEANRKHVADILANSDAMIARTSPQIDRIAKNVEAVTAKMGPTVDNVNSTVTNADGTITVLRDRTQADLVELQKTLVDVRSLVDNLQVVVRSNQQNISYTLDNIRMATDHLDDLTESVDERPWSLIRIRQPKDRNVPKNSEGK